MRGDVHGVEEGAVVGHEQERAVEGLEGRLELLDGLEVEVVGGLVEHEAVDALGHQLGEQGPGALARRQVGPGALDVVRAEAELGQQRAGLAAVEARWWP